MQNIYDYIGSFEKINNASDDDYIQSMLKHLGSLSVVLVREVIAPTVFKNQEAEMTDIELRVGDRNLRVVRAVPNKFKHKERSRGLQILRHLNAGGALPQNRHTADNDAKPSEFLDLNSLVFGDSKHQGKNVIPMKAAVLYSDGLSLNEYHECVDSTFHIQSNEVGTLFDHDKKKSTNNIFDRHFIKPGTLLVQTISTHGKMLPPEGLDHLLLSLGNAGAYGGQTSITGVNIKTHIAGVYASRFEQPSTSPFEIAKHILSEQPETDVSKAINRINSFVASSHETVISHHEATAYQSNLIRRLENGELGDQYAHAAASAATLFDRWFVGK